VKLILAHNQTERFVSFYEQLQEKSKEPFDYVDYESLLFSFDVQNETPIVVTNLVNNRSLSQYVGVYINGYIHSYESAATVSICCDALNINFVNKEFRDPPSLSKLSSYAKMAAAKISIPKTFAGTRRALERAMHTFPDNLFPAVLKRADADRGIDNFMVKTVAEMKQTLSGYENSSLWLVQEFIEHEGFYLINFYNEKPAFSIYRTLESRPDGNELKAHMYKPSGGINATLIEIKDLPEQVVSAAQQAITVMNRQIGSVDCVVDVKTGKVYVLEVNFNPQLVTIETYKEVRSQAFLDNLTNDWV
jgi:hypothetical protein